MAGVVVQPKMLIKDGLACGRVVFWSSVVQVIPIFFPNTTGPSSFIHIIFYIFRIVQELLCRYHSSGILIQNHFFKHLILLRAFYSHHNCSLQMHTYQPAPPQSFVCGIRRDKTFKSALLFNLSWASFLGRTECHSIAISGFVSIRIIL